MERWAQDVEQRAADQMLAELAVNAPRGETGRMAADSARRRTDTVSGDVFSTRIVQESGAADRPEALPNWLEEGRQFPIRARRARALRFRVGGTVIYRREVLFNRSQRSQGFWSRVMNQEHWREVLRQNAAGRSL